MLYYILSELYSLLFFIVCAVLVAYTGVCFRLLSELYSLLNLLKHSIKIKIISFRLLSELYSLLRIVILNG